MGKILYFAPKRLWLNFTRSQKEKRKGKERILSNMCVVLYIIQPLPFEDLSQ